MMDERHYDILDIYNSSSKIQSLFSILDNWDNDYKEVDGMREQLVGEYLESE